MNTHKELLDLSTIAEQFGASVRFWRREIWARRLASVRLGRKVLVRRSALEAYLKDKTRPADGEAKL